MVTTGHVILCQHNLLNFPRGALQFGQVWITSLHESMKNGIRQQPNQQLKKKKNSVAMLKESIGTIPHLLFFHRKLCHP